MNALEKTVDLLGAIAILFLVPLLYYGGGKRMSEVMLAGQAGEHFLKCVSTAGEITQPVWKELGRALNQIGCDGYSIKRERFLFEPYGKEGEITECCYVKDTEEIERQVEESGQFVLQAGDRVWLTIVVNRIPTVYFTCVRTGGGSS
ncbi:MAG: hypothetical protein IJZ55_10590 [Lachnospiraceae bacterium]|nr:hypothetical protein [Lachnospiraceae bacterium]